MYPIVEYAHKIGKNTADLTTIDMVNYMKWWMKQPVREDVERSIKQQLVRATQIHNVLQSNKKEDKIMVKKHNTQAFQAAQKSRLTSDQVEDVEGIDEDVAAAMEEEGIVTEEELDGQEEELAKVNQVIEDNEVVCSMELTKKDVVALKWALDRIFEDYDVSNDDDYGTSLESLKVGLEGV